MLTCLTDSGGSTCLMMLLLSLQTSCNTASSLILFSTWFFSVFLSHSLLTCLCVRCSQERASKQITLGKECGQRAVGGGARSSVFVVFWVKSSEVTCGGRLCVVESGSLSSSLRFGFFRGLGNLEVYTGGHCVCQLSSWTEEQQTRPRVTVATLQTHCRGSSCTAPGCERIPHRPFDVHPHKSAPCLTEEGNGLTLRHCPVFSLLPLSRNLKCQGRVSRILFS